MGSNVSHPPSDGAHMSASRMGLKTPPSLQTAVTQLMDAKFPVRAPAARSGGPPGFHTTARELQTCTFQGTYASKHHQNSTRRPPKRHRNSETVAGKGRKSAKFLAPPTLRGPTFGAPPFWAPPFGAPPFAAPLFLGLGPPPIGAPPFGAPFWVKH